MRNSWNLLIAPLAFTSNEALAVRPFVTDDARIIDEGQIEAETWLEAGHVNGVWSPAPAYNVMLGVSPNQWLEFIVGGGIGRDGEEDQLAIGNLALQAKLLLNKAEIDSIMPGFAIGAGATFDTGLGDMHHKGSNYYLAGMSTWRFDDDSFMLHINYGARMDKERGGSQRITPYWGIGFDMEAFHPEIRVIGEAFSGDPLELNDPKYSGQFGMRWLPSDFINFDITFGLQPELDEWRRDTGRIDFTGQLGIRMLFDVFTPGGKPGRADGADGLFSRSTPDKKSKRSVKNIRFVSQISAPGCQSNVFLLKKGVIKLQRSSNIWERYRLINLRILNASGFPSLSVYCH